MPYTPEISKTALLVFTRTPGEEARIKSFSRHSGSLNYLIAQELIDHTLKVAADSSLVVEVRYEHQQTGNSFGERYANAFAELFDQGYHKVVSIGNDSPGLQTAHLDQAGRLLEDTQLVLGPAHDGGVYLVALQKEAFNAQAFQNIRWESSAVQKDFEMYADCYGMQTALLNPLGDLDSEADLVYVLKEISPKTLLYQLLRLAFAQDLSLTQWGYKAFLPQDPALALQGLRAPPAPFSALVG